MFFVKFSARSDGRSNFSFMVEPLTYKFEMVRWIVEFLLNNAQTIDFDFVRLFDSLVDFIYGYYQRDSLQDRIEIERCH